MTGLSHRHFVAAILSLTILLGAVRPRAQDAALAVVVHPSNALEGMTRVELCDVLLGERQRWPDGNLIEVFVPPAGSREWRLVLRAVCRTNEANFRRQVAGRRAFGRASRLPRTFATNEEIKGRVAASPRALGFVPVPSLDPTLKALSIDGRPPSDPKYPIQPAP